MQDVESTGSSQFTSMLKVAVCCIGSPEKHFAEVISLHLYQGWGPRDFAYSISKCYFMWPGGEIFNRWTWNR